MSDFYIPSDDARPADASLSDETPPDAPAFEIPAATPDGDLVLDGGSLDGGDGQAAPDSDLTIPSDKPPPDDPAPTPEPAPLPPHPAPLPPSAPSPADGLRGRVAAVTRAGGFGGTLPPRFDDPDATPPGDDWTVALSDDPFRRLYLDWMQAGGIANATVRQHATAIARFWTRRAEQLEAGVEARDRIQRRYGDRTLLRRRAQQARDDADALATAALRSAAVAARLDTLRAQTLARLEDFLLGDSTLSPAEAERLLEQADADGWTPAAAAAFVLDDLSRRGFRSPQGAEPHADDAPPEQRLLACDWSDPDAAPSTLDPEPTTAEAALGAPLDTARLGGTLTASQVGALLDLAERLGVDREDAAAFIAERLGVFRDEWRPAPGEASVEGSLADALASVRWVSPERYPDEIAIARNALANAAAAALAGGALAPADAARLLDAADLGRGDAAEVVLETLAQRGFAPDRPPAPDASPEEALAASSWTRSAPPTPPPAPKTAVSPQSTSPGRRVGVALGVAVGALALAVAFFATRPIDSAHPVATINTDRANIRSEPSLDGEDDTIVGKSTRGEQLRVTGYTLDEDGRTWLRVEHRAGTGWVSDRIVQFTGYGNVPDLTGSSPPLPPEPTPLAGTDPLGPPRPEPPPTSTPLGDRDLTFAGGTEPTQTPRPPQTEPTPTPTPPTAPPPPAPGPPADRPYAASDVDRTARPDTSPRADSPSPGFSGAVQVGVEVSKAGRVTGATCRGAPQAVCAEAERLARGVRFQPAQIRGHAVRSRSTVTVAFSAPPQQPASATTQCTPSAIRALMVELNQTDARCRRLQDPAEKRDCEARRDRVNADLRSCTQ